MAPSWDMLYRTAASQDGLFTPAEAAAAGFSLQLLQKHMKAGRVGRVARGLYRLVHFPRGEHEDLVAAWIWSGKQGVLSHETALLLHNLSDALPANVHLTVPASWRTRRVRAPSSVVLHHADVPEAECGWVGPVPVTNVQRTIRDCIDDAVLPDLVVQAIEGAVKRGDLAQHEAADLRAEMAT